MDGASAVSSPLARWGLIPAVLVPLWFSGARLLTDTAGTLSIILALTLAPAMLVVTVLALRLPGRRRDAETSQPVRPSPRAAVLLVLSWVCGVVFGATVPDIGQGASSVSVALLGEQAAGLSAAISNPAGILMLLCAAMALGFAVVDARRAEAGPLGPVDDDAVLAAYGYTFMDDPAETAPRSH